MFSLFHKGGKMLQESMACNTKVGNSALVVITLSVLLLSEIAASFIIIFVLSITTFSSGQSDASIDQILNMNSDTTQLLSLFTTGAVIIGFLILGRCLFHPSFLSMGLTRKNVFKDYMKGLLIGFLMMTASVVIAFMCGGIQFDGIKNFSIIMLIAYFIGFMIQGFNEELMVRGFFMNACAARKSTAFAIFLNSILFAALHLLNDGISVLAFINLVLAGITFSLMAVYHDNITVCSAAHSMWNFTQGNLFGVLVSGMYMPTRVSQFVNVENKGFISGGSFGLEGGLAVMAVELITILLYCYLYKRKAAKQSIIVEEC